MYSKIKTIIKNNRTTIIISAGTCALTTLILTLTFVALVSTKTIAIGGLSGGGATSQSDGAIPTGTAAEESRVINAVAQANPAVVSIIISKDVPIYQQNYNPFGNLFGGSGNSQQNQTGTEKQEIGGGSGFFVSNDGYIVTNNHVVEDSTAEYTVLTSNGKKYNTKILAKDSTLDVAILKVDGTGFSYLSFADSDSIKLGQTAIAIGNALAEFQNSISMGIVSGLSRSITAGNSTASSSEQLEGVIQTDAAINPGNSGGPLLDIKGNVIGVNVAVENSAENIGFALPSNMVKAIADSVRQTGTITKAYLGVRYVQITDTIQKNNNLSVNYGVLVSAGESSDNLAVIPGSPADKAGIVENDIILEIDGVKLESDKSLASIVRQKQVGQTITLKLLHRGDSKEITVKLEKAPTGI